MCGGWPSFARDFLRSYEYQIKSDLCRIVRLRQFVHLRCEHLLTLAYYNRCQYIENMISYTNQAVKTNNRLRADLHFGFPQRSHVSRINQSPRDH